MNWKNTYPVPVGLATPDVGQVDDGQVVVHGAVTVTVQVSVTVGQVLSLTGAAQVDDGLTGLLGLTGEAGLLQEGEGQLDSGVGQVGAGEGQVGEGEGQLLTGQTVVETATTEVTTVVSVCFSG
jgi:hypothetical protein